MYGVMTKAWLPRNHQSFALPFAAHEESFDHTVSNAAKKEANEDDESGEEPVEDA